MRSERKSNQSRNCDQDLPAHARLPHKYTRFLLFERYLVRARDVRPALNLAGDLRAELFGSAADRGNAQQIELGSHVRRADDATYFTI